MLLLELEKKHIEPRSRQEKEQLIKDIQRMLDETPTLESVSVLDIEPQVAKNLLTMDLPQP